MCRSTGSASATRTAAKAPPSRPTNVSKASLMSSFEAYLLLALSILLIAQSAHLRVEAKPLNQYQVKFRRLPPKEFSAALGSSITIECEAGASPPPTIHWLKNGKRILQSEFDENQLDDLGGVQSIQVDDVTRIALSASRSRLYIDCADFSDEATYTCVAENAYSRVSSQTKLNLIKPAPAQNEAGSENELAAPDEVTAALSELAAARNVMKAMEGGNAAGQTNSIPLSAVPQCLSARLRTGSVAPAPARIHMWTHNIVEVMKNNVVLYCRSNIKRPHQQQQQSQQQDLINTNSNGNNNDKQEFSESTQSQNLSNSNKKLLVSWTLPDDKPVSEDLKYKYEILETGDLLIKDLSWNDMGSYVCTVSDEQSSDSVSSFVYPASVKSSAKRTTATSNSRALS